MRGNNEIINDCITFNYEEQIKIELLMDIRQLLIKQNSMIEESTEYLNKIKEIME